MEQTETSNESFVPNSPHIPKCVAVQNFTVLRNTPFFYFTPTSDVTLATRTLLAPERSTKTKLESYYTVNSISTEMRTQTLVLGVSVRSGARTHR